MKNIHYFRLCFNIIPSYCKPITYTAVISEPFESFIIRNYFQGIEVNMLYMCSKEDYELYKRFNPTEEGYVKMLKQDYKNETF